MIKSYKEEIKTKNRKDLIFWILVFIFASYLYLFFQGYYLNIDLNLKTSKKQEIFKQFGIINLSVFPDPDSIYINGAKYSNVSKSIFDFGKYDVLIEKKGYIKVFLNIFLNSKNSFYTNTINLIKDPIYYEIKENFDLIDDIGDYFLSVDKKNKIITTYYKDLKIKKILALDDYFYIGKNYFSSGGNIFFYDSNLNQIKPMLKNLNNENLNNKDLISEKITEKNIIKCKNVRIIGNEIFCYDNMSFLDSSKNFPKNEKILRINNDIILTNNFIYNNSQNSDWNYFKHNKKDFIDPENIVLYSGIPYFLKNGNLYNLQTKKKQKLELKQINKIFKAKNFGDEIMLLGQSKDFKNMFYLFDGKREYTGFFKNIDIRSMDVYKNNGVYLFKTKDSFFIYYKGGKNIIKIISGDILSFFNEKIFFKMNSKNYYMSLSEE